MSELLVDPGSGQTDSLAKWICITIGRRTEKCFYGIFCDLYEEENNGAFTYGVNPRGWRNVENVPTLGTIVFSGQHDTPMFILVIYFDYTGR